MILLQIKFNQFYRFAHQCPYAGGKYVFLARAMYHMVNPDEEYYDNDLCTSLGIFENESWNARSGFVGSHIPIPLMKP